MNILFEIGHPAHVHFFKNVIWNLKKKGHEVLITAKKKEVALDLLDSYGLKYEVMGSNYKGILKKSYGLIKMDYKLLKVARMFKPDLLVGRGSPYLAHLSFLTHKPYIAFVDTEHARLIKLLSHPFASTICVPSCYRGDIDPKKEVRFNGYKELAYLHPNYFTPDPSVLEDVGLSEDDKFIILRFVAWNASHDVGHSSIGNETKIKYVSELEKHSRVFISSEVKLGKEFEKYKLKISPEKFHSLLSYAQLYIGEGGTIATEAGILGVPSVYVSSLVGTMGNFDELEKRYELVYSFKDSKLALDKALELLEDENTKKKWRKKRKKLLNEKTDVTKFMVEFIENYPESFHVQQKGCTH
jgi:predicted glycosyltransferase